VKRRSCSKSLCCPVFSLQSDLVGVCVGKINMVLWQYLYSDTAPARFFYLSHWGLITFAN
jgi:hypothetical protein